jgi:G1/S-specific cyclin-D2
MLCQTSIMDAFESSESTTNLNKITGINTSIFDSGNSSQCSSIENTTNNNNTANSSATLFDKLNKSPIDKNILKDDRLIDNLLNMEDFYRIQSNYFLYVQTEIKPWMRKTLANWMLEVCKNQSREEDIFVLAMNILDRFLSVQPIGKRHLQLLGSVCMFIAAKLRSAVQFNAETLVIYTANSITIEELLNWEQFVLHKLRWDICCVTPNDFVPHLLNKLNLIEQNNENLSTLISACATDFRFSLLPSSMIASACIYLSIKSTKKMSQLKSDSILQMLQDETGIDSECLKESIKQIEDTFRTSLDIEYYQIETTTATTLTINNNKSAFKKLSDHTNRFQNHEYTKFQSNKLCQMTTC